jgi:hypothetical protein
MRKIRIFSIGSIFNTVKALIFVCTLLCIIFLAYWRIMVPPNPSTAAIDNGFSVARAMIHLREIARNPRPTGSLEIKRVRNYIVTQLKGLGLQPEIQRSTSIIDFGKGVRASVVENVLVKLPGNLNGKSLLLSMHYDTIPDSPGAGDNGASVATALETIHALKSIPPHRNDIIFLFCDSEESGFGGVQAFIEDHPWALNVGMAVNFDAVGNGGSSFLIETSEGNVNLIKELAEMREYPVACSPINDVYTLMGSSSDFTVFKRHHIPGFFVSIVGGLVAFHSMLDTSERMNGRTLLHHGTTMYALAKYFANSDLDRLRSHSNAVFFTLFNRFFHFHLIIMALFSTLACIFAGIVIYRCIRKGLVKSVKMLIGFILFAAMCTMISLLSWSIWHVICFICPQYALFPINPYNLIGYVAAFILIVMAMLFISVYFINTTFNLQNMYAGFLLIQVVLLISSVIILPGCSYIFLFTVVITSLILLLVLQTEYTGSSSLLRITTVMCTIPIMLVFVPLAYVVIEAMGIEMIHLFSILMVMALFPAVPAYNSFDKPVQRNTVLLILVAALFILIGNTYSFAPDMKHPLFRRTWYISDADAKKAYVREYRSRLSTQYYFNALRESFTDPVKGAVTGEYSNKSIPFNGRFTQEIKVLTRYQGRNGQMAVLQIKGTCDIPLICRIRVKDAHIRQALLNGTSLPVGKDGFNFVFYGLSKDGMELTLEKTTSMRISVDITTMKVISPGKQEMYGQYLDSGKAFIVRKIYRI